MGDARRPNHIFRGIGQHRVFQYILRILGGARGRPPHSAYYPVRVNQAHVPWKNSTLGGRYLLAPPRAARSWRMSGELHEATSGYYAALGLTFDAAQEDVKKAYRKASLKWHPDRNRGDGAEEAKRMFQVVNSAFACLSEPARRKEYDGIFRMRCVLEQGRITEQMLRERPLDCVYMFAVQHHTGMLGSKEDNVLLLSLGSGLEGAKVERVRNGEIVDSRPLSSVRSAEADVGSSVVKLLLREPSRASGEAGRSSTLQLSARSASDAASICTLLRALISLAITGAPALTFRTDDCDMPPPARMAGWLTVRTGQKFGGLSKPFALLGRSKLLMFTDRTCASPWLLLTRAR